MKFVAKKNTHKSEHKDKGNESFVSVLSVCVCVCGRKLGYKMCIVDEHEMLKINFDGMVKTSDICM